MSDGYRFDLGQYRRRPAVSDDPDAHRWFERGLVWSYAFHHEEAIACFERALEHDPACAMAHWGIAYAVGPNYNLQWEAFEAEELRVALQRAHAESRRAVEHASTPLESALGEALCARYPQATPREDQSDWNEDYAVAMRAVYAAHGDDLDVCALHADALLNVTAWQLWDLRSGRPAEGAHTVEAREVLETAMGRDGGMSHPGVLHFYIHLMEMSPEPETALAAGDALRELVPGAGHLVHMPTHIDVLTGDYARVIADNERAVTADELILADLPPTGFYRLYHAHDLHFVIYGAMFAGRRATALAAADALAAALPADLLRAGMADFLEAFVGMRLHALVRFGAWDELIATPLPDDPELYCVTTALTHYARGVALAATGRVDDARDERAALAAAVARVPGSRYLFNNTAADILAVAAAMLDGEIAYRDGDLDAAWAGLERAIELDDSLPYDEPWGWMQPTRHAYGALLLEQGEVERAAAVYAADLGLDDTLPRACRHPRNVWSLHGYHECLARLARAAEADALRSELARATAAADVEITSSCFCRMGAAAA